MTSDFCMIQWAKERLEECAEQDYICKKSHRKFLPSKFSQGDVRYFYVPLASGRGTAVLISSREPRRDNPLIIFMHGLGFDATFPMRHTFKAWTDAGFSVLSVDWDGHSHAHQTNLDFQEATRTLPLLLNRLFQHPNLNNSSNPTCFFGGHGMGATMCLIAASRVDVAHFVRGVIAISPAIQIYHPILNLLELWSLRELFYSFFRVFGMFSFYGLKSFIPYLYYVKDKIFEVRFKIDVAEYEQLNSFLHEYFCEQNILKLVKIPVLFIHGIRDRFHCSNKTRQKILEIPVPVFCYQNEKQGFFSTIFSQSVVQYCSHFVNSFLPQKNHEETI